jgi:hypothetical protein
MVIGTMYLGKFKQEEKKKAQISLHPTGYLLYCAGYYLFALGSCISQVYWCLLYFALFILTVKHYQTHRVRDTPPK